MILPSLRLPVYLFPSYHLSSLFSDNGIVDDNGSIDNEESNSGGASVFAGDNGESDNVGIGFGHDNSDNEDRCVSLSQASTRHQPKEWILAYLATGK